jgi:hypothetical protein
LSDIFSLRSLTSPLPYPSPCLLYSCAMSHLFYYQLFLGLRPSRVSPIAYLVAMLSHFISSSWYLVPIIAYVIPYLIPFVGYLLSPLTHVAFFISQPVSFIFQCNFLSCRSYFSTCIRGLSRTLLIPVHLPLVSPRWPPSSLCRDTLILVVFRPCVSCVRFFSIHCAR